MTFLVFSGQCRAPVAWFGYGLACVWLAVALAWWLCARFDYGYPFWYDALAIDQHIDRYAPQNPEKPGFAQLPREQHLRAFTQISESVHSGGRGLEAITYPGPRGETIRLLNTDEINHLRDVARLLNGAALVSALPALLWLPLAMVLRRTGMPSRRARALTVGAAMVTIGGLLTVFGPEKVFYTLHEWLFPPEHPWFFYWQESLMSTLMKAPVLFGGIAVLIAVVALPLIPALYRVGDRLAAFIVTRRGRSDAY